MRGVGGDSAQSCLILCNPLDCSPSGSVHGVSQARILEWVAISFSRGSSRPRDQTRVSCISCIGRRFCTGAPLGQKVRGSLSNPAAQKSGPPEGSASACQLPPTPHGLQRPLLLAVCRGGRMAPARERGASPTVQAGASEARLSFRVGARRAQGPETGGAPWPPPSQHRVGIGGYQARRTASNLASEPFITCGNSKNVKPEEKGGPGGWGAPCFPWGSRGPRAPASGEDSDPQSGGEGALACRGCPLPSRRGRGRGHRPRGHSAGARQGEHSQLCSRAGGQCSAGTPAGRPAVCSAPRVAQRSRRGPQRHHVHLSLTLCRCKHVLPQGLCTRPVAHSCLTLCGPMDCSPTAPLSVGSPRQEHWSGLPCPPPGESHRPRDRTWVPCIGFFTSEPLGKPKLGCGGPLFTAGHGCT